MNLKSLLYKAKKQIAAKNIEKVSVPEGTNIVIVDTKGDISNFEKLYPSHKVVNSIDVVSRSDYSKIEIYMGSPQKQLLKQMTSLKWLQLSSAGLNGYDEDSLYSNKPKVTTAKGIYGIPISECVIGDIVFLMKPALSNKINKNHFISVSTAKEFLGSNVVVCGLGDIGLNVAKRCKGMQCSSVIGVDCYTPDCEYIDKVYPINELKNIIIDADIVVSALPQLPETDNIFNKEMFSAMKKGAIFVNVGRGNAVDQNALFDALNTKQLFGAALDVTTPDPLPKSHKLRKCKRLIITDHLACISGNNSMRLYDFYLVQSETYTLGDI